MTVIAGFVDKKTGIVYVGADKGVFEGDNYYISPEPKILKKPIGINESNEVINMIIGNSGDVKPQNIITHWNTNQLKYNPKRQSAHEFVIKTFVPKLKQLFENNGYKNPDFEFIVGFNKKIYKIQSDYSVIIPPSYGVAIGAAGIPAQSVLFALDKIKKLKITPKAKVQLAIKTSIGISNTAAGNVDILYV